MKGPERIFLQWYDDDEVGDEGITWCVDKIEDEDVEYIRLDLYEAVQATIAELQAKIKTDRLDFVAVMANWEGR